MDKKANVQVITIKPNYNDYIYWNKGLQTYGNAVKVDRKILRAVIAIIAAIPIGTSWMFLLLPKIKDIVFRY